MAAECRAGRGPPHAVAVARDARHRAPSGREGQLMRVALINPHWHYEGSIYFGCRSPHLPLELGIAQRLLREAGHKTLLIDAHLFGLSETQVVDEVRAFAPDMTVVTTAPTYLFWRCAPPELRVPRAVVQQLRDLVPLLVAVGPHGSTTPRAAMRKLGVDIVVMGECEESLLRLANADTEFPGLAW